MVEPGQQLPGGGDVPAPARLRRGTMAREQPPHVESSQPLQRVPQCSLVPAGEVGAAEAPIRKNRVARDQVVACFVIQADPTGGMAGGVDHPQSAHPVPVPEQPVGGCGRSPLAEEHGSREEVAREPRGIGGVDADLSAGHVPDLGQAGGVVVVAVGEDNHLDLSCKGPDLQGGDPRIDQDVVVEVGVGGDPAPGDPSDGHEE